MKTLSESTLERTEKKKGTNFCSTKKLVQATKFLVSRPIFPASPSKMYFCIDTAAPQRKVLSLASSRILNNSCEDIGNLEGLAWTRSCKELGHNDFHKI